MGATAGSRTTAGAEPVLVTDPEDPRLDPYRRLGARERRDPGRIVVESELAVGRLLESGHVVDSVLVAAGRAPRLLTRLPPGTPLLAAAPDLIDAVTGLRIKRGCLAAAPRPRPPAALGPVRRAVALWGVTDPVNVGAICRSARAFGVDLVVTGPGADPYAPRAVRAAMGHVFLMPVVPCPDEPALAALLRGLGLTVVAASARPGAEPLGAAPVPEPWALLFGHEGQGLSPAALALADRELTIPIAPTVDSLNVGAAAAVLLHALTRS